MGHIIPLLLVYFMIRLHICMSHGKERKTQSSGKIVSFVSCRLNDLKSGCKFKKKYYVIIIICYFMYFIVVNKG